MNLWIEVTISTHHMIDDVSSLFFDKCHKYLYTLWHSWSYFFSNICNLIARWSCQHQNVLLMSHHDDVSTAFLWQKDLLKQTIIHCTLSFLDYLMFKLRRHSFIYSSFHLLLISQQIHLLAVRSWWAWLWIYYWSRMSFHELSVLWQLHVKWVVCNQQFQQQN